MTARAAAARAARAGDGRARLVLAAEKLFATRGFDVPNRDIIAAAGHRNKSAISYHFGSRVKLFEAVWYLHSAPVNLHRAELMAQLPPPQERTSEQLVDAHIQPFVAEMLSYTPSYWARFNEQQLLGMPLRFTRRLDSDLQQRDDGPPLQVLADLFGLIEAHLTQLSAADAADRVALTFRFVISSFARWERDCEAGIDGVAPLPHFAASISDLAVLLLDAPSSQRLRTLTARLPAD